ncbi:harpin HrpZ family protein [Pseudomonas sp. 21LCFQ02]|uniref:DNA-binding protein n=2 Tax=Pseudomonadota TaxID=1224 RepID=UPI0004F84445|nr:MULTISPECIES: DNA-binding protein [unclassified Pseudomonas]MCO8161116.1 harpin HrpZ family protein [Pseudomonas sp. 21LCFQ010]MCO8169087.1 harpin HrpZ family protein [Pseudomonas sp. 21LCFQ02]MCQ9422092.1 harpin HrpZ family protein [Pseudomonas sp. LJDD11]BAP46086.1 type III secretion protein HrpZ [Pseudomonas sp. StFLB209]
MFSSSIGGPQAGAFQSTFASTQTSALQSSSSEAAGQIASLLSDALLEKSGSGANIRNADNPLIGMVADHMDRNPEKYGKPHDANGRVDGWRDELSEDNYLDGREKAAFTKGLEGLISEFLSGGSSGQSSIGQGTSGQGAFGQGSLGQGGLGGSRGAASPSAGCNQGWGGNSLAGAGGAGAGGGLQSLLSSLLGSLGEEKLDNLLKPVASQPASIGALVKGNTNGMMSFNPEDKDVLKEISRFMDMHPEEFGKPDGKSKDWMGELSEGDFVMSKAESQQYMKAIDMIKGEIKGSAEGNSLGGLFPDAQQNFQNGGAGNTLKTDASIAAGNILSVLVQQSVTESRG